MSICALQTVWTQEHRKLFGDDWVSAWAQWPPVKLLAQCSNCLRSDALLAHQRELVLHAAAPTNEAIWQRGHNPVVLISVHPAVVVACSSDQELKP